MLKDTQINAVIPNKALGQEASSCRLEREKERESTGPMAFSGQWEEEELTRVSLSSVVSDSA